MGRFARFVGEQAGDAHAHVGQASGGIQSRRDRKSQVGGCDLCTAPAGRFEQRTDAGHATARANAGETLSHQYPVVAIQRHHVGDRPKGHQIEQFSRSKTLLPEMPCESRDDVKRHAHTGQGGTFEPAVRQVWIDDDVGTGQNGGGQVMIRHQHRDAQFSRRLHACDARHAVIDGDYQRGLACGRQRHDFGRETVTETKPVGYEEVGVCKMHGAQRAHHQCAAGGTVGVEIANHEDASGGAVRGQQLSGCIDALQRSDRQQSIQREIQLRVGAHPARRVDAPQNGVHGRGDSG